MWFVTTTQGRAPVIRGTLTIIGTSIKWAAVMSIIVLSMAAWAAVTTNDRTQRTKQEA